MIVGLHFRLLDRTSALAGCLAARELPPQCASACFFSAILISLIADTHLSLTVVYSGTSLSVSELSTGRYPERGRDSFRIIKTAPTGELERRSIGDGF